MRELQTQAAAEDIEAPSRAEHPGPTPAAPPAPISGRDDYAARIGKLNMLLPGEPVLMLRGQDLAFDRAARAYAAVLFELGGPKAMVESALQLADKGAAFKPKKLPDADHLAEHQQLQLEYQLTRRAWKAEAAYAGPDAIALAEMRGISLGASRLRLTQDALRALITALELEHKTPAERDQAMAAAKKTAVEILEP